MIMKKTPIDLRNSLLSTALKTTTACGAAGRVAMIAAALATTSSAATLYWDANGDIAGSGNTDADWDSGTNWSTSADGDIATVGWTDGETAVFSAGTDGTNFTAFLTGTVATPSMIFEEAGDTVTIDGGVVTIGGGSIDSSALGTGGGRNVVLNTDLAGAGGLTIAAHGDTSDTGGGSNSELELAGISSFTGDLTITSGVVSFIDDDSFGGAGNRIILNGGGLLDPNRNLNINNDVEILAGGGVIRSYGAASTLLNGTLSGSGMLRKTDTGILIIDSDNSATFTGPTRIGAGQLQISSDTALGAVPAAPTPDAISMANGGRITADADLTLPANRGITMESGDTGFNTLSGFTNTVEGPIVGGASSSGRLTATGAGSLVLNGDIDLDAGMLVTGGETIVNGDLSLSTGEVRVEGGAILNINSTDAFISGGFNLGAGTTNIGLGGGAGGTLQIADWELGNNGNQPHVSNLTSGDVLVSEDFRIGHWGGSDSTVNVSGGSISQPDTVSNPTDEFQANLFLGIDGTGNLNITDGTVNTTSLIVDGRGTSGGTETLTLTGGTLNIGKWGIRNNGSYLIQFGGGTVGTTSSSTEPGYNWASSWSSNSDIEFTGTNGDTAFAAGNHAITLGGVLSGAGGFSVESGGLVLSGATNTFAGTVNVNGGTLFPTGSKGAGLAPVVVQNGGSVQGGTPTAVGVGSFETLDLQDGSSSIYRLDFLTPDSIEILAADGLSTTGTHTIVPIPTGDLQAGDFFEILTYSGTIQGAGFSAFQIGGASNPHLNFSLTDTGSSIQLEIDSIEPISWTGSTDGLWEINGTQNWEIDSDMSATGFFDFDRLTFPDGTPNTDITVSGGVQIAGATFLNDTDTYTFTGDGIGGPGGIEFLGLGTVRLFNNNTYAGDTLVNGGTLIVGNGTTGNLPAGTTVSVEGGGTLELNLDPSVGFATNVALNNGTLLITGDQTVSSTIAGMVPSVIQVDAPNSLTSTGTFSGTVRKTGSGDMFSSASTGTLIAAEGTLTSTGFAGNVDYVVEPTGTLNINYGTGATYNIGITVQGAGLGSPNFFLESGRNINLQRNGGLRVTTAPTTLRASDTGVASLRGFDINGTNMTIEADASGTVIDPTLQIRTEGFGYRMSVASGPNTATGDLVINSDMPSQGGSVGRAGFEVNLQKWDTGSVLLNGFADLPEGAWVREGSIVLGADERIGDAAGIALGDGAVTGKLVLNGFTETVSDIGVHNSSIGSSIVNGSPTTGTLVVNYSGAGRNFAGVIGGAGDDGNLNLVKSGTGTLTILTPLAHTGSTSVSEGTLSLTTASLDDNAELNISGTGLLDLNHADTDVVGLLVIDGVAQPDGTYGATGSGATNIDDTRFSGTGVILVGTPADPYGAYETANNIGGAGADVDSDGDGIDNGIEFVIGGVSDPGVGQNDSDKLPTSTVDATHLTFNFRRTDGSADSNPYVEYGSDLVGWTEAQGGVDGVVINEYDDDYAAGVDRVEVIIPRALATGDKLFARLRVDIP